MKTILTAVDFSPVTDSVVAAAADLARAAQGRVLLLHVIQAPSALDNFVDVNYAGIMSSPYRLAGGEGAASAMTETERRADGRLNHLAWTLTGLAVETSLATGEPVDEILRVARGESADFIVMGLHSHNSLYEVLVGSTAHGVLKKAPCQVLFVPGLKSCAKDAGASMRFNPNRS